jgi:hypothetical protein
VPLVVFLVTAALTLLHGGAQSDVLHVSPTGSDRAACTSTSPCASFNRAYQLAKPGQTVEVAAGSYSAQTITPSSRQDASPVVFRPEPNGAVSTGEIRINGASGLELRDLTINDYYVAEGSSSITFRNVSTRFFFIRSASAISIIGGSVGGEGDAVSPTVGATDQSAEPSRDVVIDGVDFHDITRANKPSNHVECLFVQSVDGLTVRNSRFHNCDVFDVYVHKIGIGPVPANVTFEDDFFDAATNGGFYSLFVSMDQGYVFEHLVLRHNSFAQSFHLDPGSYADTAVVGNVSPLRVCTAGVAYSYNVFDHVACDPSDRLAALGFVNAAGFDLHLARGAAALGLDQSRDAPQRDIDGDFRPVRAAFDAGADQRETALIVPGRSLGGVHIGMSPSDVTQLFGPSRRVRKLAYGAGAPRVTVASFGVHGGLLWVVYDHGSVVGVGTTSAYYTTGGGLGPGVPVNGGAAGRWLPCSGVYRKATAGMATDFVPQAGRRTAPIESVFLLGSGYRGPKRCG